MKRKLFFVSAIFVAFLVMSFYPLKAQFSVKGKGDIKKETHQVDNFTEIEVSRGLDIFISQGDVCSVDVIADENLHEYITVEVSDGRLKVSASRSIQDAKAKKVNITVAKLEKLEASSGVNVSAITLFKSENLTIEAGSGADLEMEIEAENIFCDVSSGADIQLQGSTKVLKIEAASGCDVKAGRLSSNEVHVEASSGCDVAVLALEAVYVEASSGSDVVCGGNPKIVKTEISSSADFSMLK